MGRRLYHQTHHMISFEQTVPWLRKKFFCKLMIYRNHLVLEKLLHLQVRENYYGDLICDPPKFTGASQVVLVVKKPPARARDIRDTGSVLGSGRSPGGGMATHSSVLACRIPWTEEAWWTTVHGVAKSWT